MQGPNRYAYVGGNPETLTDPSGHELACQNPDVACHTGIRLSGANPSTSVDVSGCMGYTHCVIFIDGPNVLNSNGIPNTNKTEDSLQTQKGQWGVWRHFYEKEYGKGNVGFIYCEAPDTAQGAARIQSALHELHAGGYGGTMALVGHSNGASAILRYFANEEHAPTNDTHVNSFVLLDAPAFG